MYWAQALAEQSKNPELQAKFAKLAQELIEDEATILAELNGSQGQAVDVGGYYHPDREKAIQAMRPSAVFNSSIELLGQM
jgi:isocitrate dehydrogenase